MIVYRTFPINVVNLISSNSVSFCNKKHLLDIDVNKQGNNRHDIVKKDVVIYCSLNRKACIAERLKYLRNLQLNNDDFEYKNDMYIVIADINIDDKANLLDLTDPKVLVKYKLSPLDLATRNRDITQKVSREIYNHNFDGFIWWSTSSLP